MEQIKERVAEHLRKINFEIISLKQTAENMGCSTRYLKKIINEYNIPYKGRQMKKPRIRGINGQYTVQLNINLDYQQKIVEKRPIKINKEKKNVKKLENFVNELTF